MTSSLGLKPVLCFLLTRALKAWVNRRKNSRALARKIIVNRVLENGVSMERNTTAKLFFYLYNVPNETGIKIAGVVFRYSGSMPRVPLGMFYGRPEKSKMELPSGGT